MPFGNRTLVVPEPTYKHTVQPQTQNSRAIDVINITFGYFCAGKICVLRGKFNCELNLKNMSFGFILLLPIFPTSFLFVLFVTCFGPIFTFGICKQYIQGDGGIEKFYIELKYLI